MSLEQLAYLAQIVGIIGVMGSLLYVGRQVSQNTEQMQINASSLHAQWVDQVFSRIALDRDFAEVWIKGDQDLESLDEVDRVRVTVWDVGVLYMWAHFHYLHEKKHLPEHRKLAQLWGESNFGSRQSMIAAWDFSKASYSESFRQHMGRHASLAE